MIDLALSDNQQQILDHLGKLLSEKSPVSRLRPSGRDEDVHADLAEWGWISLGLPEETDGLGTADQAILFFEAGRFLLSPSLLASTLAARICADEQRGEIVAGSKRAAIAFATGDRICVLEQDKADLLVLVEPERIGVHPAASFDGAPVECFDETLPMSAGTLDRSDVIAEEPAERARLLVSAILAGIARESCDLAVGYAKVREQFGQPIGAFQAIKHMCADMGVRAYAAEAQVKMAAVLIAEQPAQAELQCRGAALTALIAARDNSADAIQIHGGIGFTAECDAHVFLKRAHIYAQLLGGREYCAREVLAVSGQRVSS